MNPCCCLSNRFGVLTLGIILTINYAMHLLLAFLHRDFMKTRVGESPLLGLYASQSIMLLVALLVVFAAIYKQRWLLMPFIVVAMISELSVIILVVMLIAGSAGTMDSSLLTALANGLITLFLTTWALWACIIYFLELGRSEGYDGIDDKNNLPPRRRADDSEGSDYFPRRNSAEEGRGKMTVVKKMMMDFK